MAIALLHDQIARQRAVKKAQGARYYEKHKLDPEFKAKRRTIGLAWKRKHYALNAAKRNLWQVKNRERYLATRRRYRAKNRDRLLRELHDYRLKNKASLLAKARHGISTLSDEYIKSVIRMSKIYNPNLAISQEDVRECRERIMKRRERLKAGEITFEMAKKIRKLHASGHTCMALAVNYKSSERKISEIVLNKILPDADYMPPFQRKKINHVKRAMSNLNAAGAISKFYEQHSKLTGNSK